MTVAADHQLAQDSELQSMRHNQEFYQFYTAPTPPLWHLVVSYEPARSHRRPATEGITMKVKLWTCAALVGALGAALGTAADVQATSSTATSTVLAKGTVAPVDVYSHGKTLAGRRWRAELMTHGLTDGYVVDNKFDPGQSTGWHSHPGPSLVFVVSGSVTNYDSDAPRCAGVTYEAGSSFVDVGGNDVHMLRNDGTVAAETIAVQFIPSGQPRRIDETVPHGCTN